MAQITLQVTEGENSGSYVSQMPGTYIGVFRGTPYYLNNDADNAFRFEREAIVLTDIMNKLKHDGWLLDVVA